MIMCRTFFKDRLDIVLSICLIISISTVYYQVQDHGFISYDDPDYVTHNDNVKKGLTINSVKWAFQFSRQGDHTYWHPMTWLSHMADYQFFELNPSGHHIMNLIFHVVNALLLFYFLRITTGTFFRSACVAAIFALHPMNVDSVAWVAERKNLLSSFFWFLSILTYVWYTRKPGKGRYVSVCVVMILGLLSKPMLVTLPCVLLLLDYWPLKRIEIGSDAYAFFRKGWDLFKEKIPLFALSFIWSAISMVSIHRIGAQISVPSRPMDLRISNAVVSYVKYIMKLVWPFDLAIIYPYPSYVAFWKAAAAALVMLFTCYIILGKVKKYPWLLVGWCWYLGTLVPVLGLTQNGLWPEMADRWAYIPAVGILIILVWGVHRICEPIMHKPKAIAVAVLIYFAALMMNTWIQTGYWSDNIILFTHALDVTEDNSPVHCNLGVALINQGVEKETIDRYQEAVKHFKKSLDILPNTNAYYNLGLIFFKLGEFEKAVQYYKNALRLDPVYIEAYINLGIALQEQRKYQEAIQYYKNALEIDSDYEKAYSNIGITLVEQNKPEEALVYFKQALQINPEPSTHNNMGLILSKMGKNEEAMGHYRKALRMDPNYIWAHINFGHLLKKTDQEVKAVHHYSEALKINPRQTDVHRNLAMIFYEREQVHEASKHLTFATNSPPNIMEIHRHMANAYTAEKKYDKAISALKKILTLNPELHIVYYNIACLYALKNEHELSVKWLGEAIEKGYHNWHLIKTDKHLENIRETTEYKALINNEPK